AALLWHVVYVVRRVRGGPEAVARKAGRGVPFLWEVNVLLGIGVGVAASQMLLLGLTTTSSYRSRYVDTAGTFFAPAAAAALVIVLRQIGVLLGLDTLLAGWQSRPAIRKQRDGSDIAAPGLVHTS